MDVGIVKQRPPRAIRLESGTVPEQRIDTLHLNRQSERPPRCELLSCARKCIARAFVQTHDTACHRAITGQLLQEIQQGLRRAASIRSGKNDE